MTANNPKTMNAVRCIIICSMVLEVRAVKMILVTEVTKAQTGVHKARHSEPAGLCELGSKLRFGSVPDSKISRDRLLDPEFQGGEDEDQRIDLIFELIPHLLLELNHSLFEKLTPTCGKVVQELYRHDTGSRFHRVPPLDFRRLGKPLPQIVRLMEVTRLNRPQRRAGVSHRVAISCAALK